MWQSHAVCRWGGKLVSYYKIYMKGEPSLTILKCVLDLKKKTVKMATLSQLPYCHDKLIKKILEMEHSFHIKGRIKHLNW